MQEHIGELFSKGLEEGFGGGGERQIEKRGPFLVETTQYASIDGGLYCNQWIADTNGGGQEIAQKDDTKFTRLHAGGVVGVDQLAQMGITKKDVIKFLKKNITTHGSSTRLSSDCNPSPEGDWQYSYTVLQYLEDLDLTLALERITYKGQPVFAHGFLSSPVK